LAGRTVRCRAGIERDNLLDVDARELVLDGRRVALTQLEFGVMRYVAERRGKVRESRRARNRSSGL
jgi:DNA-binding response OmpR family regulator